MHEKQGQKHKKTRQMLEANGMKVKRKIVWKKTGRIRSQQIRESCGIQPINEWLERRRRRRRREWDQHVKKNGC